MTPPQAPHTLTAQQRQTLLWLACGVVLLWLIYLLRPILTPFVIGAMLAYMIEPAVRALCRWGNPRGKRPWVRVLAVLLMVAVLVLATLALSLILVPLLSHQASELVTRLPQVLVQANEVLRPRLKAWFDLSIQFDVATLKAWLTEQLQSADGIGKHLTASLKMGSLALIGALGTTLMIPVVLIYLAMDWPALVSALDKAIPRRIYPVVSSSAREIDAVMAQFLRGQLTVMLCLAVYYPVGLWLAGLDFALPIGVVTGLLVFIPYLGFGVGVLLAALVGALQVLGGTLSLGGVGAVIAVFVVGQVVEGFYLTPRLVGKRVGLHPLAILFALLAFGQLFGFFGVLVAVPASAILLILLRRVQAAYFASAFYLGKPS